jgi:Na+-transporting NADH:ubiquinone oxidoreductase subunit A
MEKLTKGKIHVCMSPNAKLPIRNSDKTKYHTFDGPHPAGLAGTHIHFIDPVSLGKTVWQIGIQDVITIGHLFLKGKISTERVISLAGPMVKNPRLIKTQMGSSVMDLTIDELKEDKELRRISGSVLSGNKANDQALGYLGRYHQQVSVIKENNQREFLGMITPGMNRFSIKNVFLAKLLFGKKFHMTSGTNGSKRAMVPIGSYEKIMPLDIIATYMLRSAIARDTDKLMSLGGLELIEEDLALCTFVCPSKYDYGPILRDNLNIIEKEEFAG